MLIHPNFDKVAFSLGPLDVHWYGISYLVGFLLAWFLGRVRAKQPGSGWTEEQVSDLIFYCALGLLLGARVGYILFYNLGEYLADPLEILKVWKGGLSFHGGFLGIMIAVALFRHKVKKGFFEITDFTAPLAPLGLLSGRLANFVNAELYGRESDVPWAMQFPYYDTAGMLKWTEPRHASQLYEAFLEGLVLFIILWFYSRKPRPTMAVSAVFLLGYSSFRFFVEFYRKPDDQLGYLAFNWFTMGQLLCIPMFIAGVVLIVLAQRRTPVET